MGARLKFPDLLFLETPRQKNKRDKEGRENDKYLIDVQALYLCWSTVKGPLYDQKIWQI